MTITATSRARELPQTTPRTARANLTAEYRVLTSVVDTLEGDDWSRPTDCIGWSVRDMVAHLAGAAECATSKAAMARHYGYAWRMSLRGSSTFVDHLSASQVRARASLGAREIVADLARWAAEAPAKGEAWPPLLRRLPLPTSTGLPRGATLAYFVDVIATRDVWMHRVDLARALGSQREVTVAEPEVVRQVVRDLDLHWQGPALELTLEGEGGGSWRVGVGEPVAHVTEDAVSFLRLLSGRSDECSLRSDGDPAAAESLRAARVVF